MLKEFESAVVTRRGQYFFPCLDVAPTMHMFGIILHGLPLLVYKSSV